MYNDYIDIQKGLSHMAGKKEIYIKIVNAFISGSVEKIEDLKGFFAVEDFNRLMIEFHGVKSSSSAVGSTLLPVIALELESAARQGNNELIKEKFDEFISQYEDTCAALDEAVEDLW